MSHPQNRKAGQYMLWILAVGGIYLITLVWLKNTHPSAIGVAAPTLTIALLSFVLVLTARHTKGMDEVLVASQRYAHSAGFGVGALLALGLLTIPPFVSWLTDLVYLTIHASPDALDRRAARVAFAYGGLVMMVIQSLVTIIAAHVWWRRMGGAQERLG